MDVSSVNPTEAAKTAARIFRPVLDIYNFYDNQHSLKRMQIILVFEQRGRVHEVDISEESLRRLRPRKNASDLTQQLLASVKGERLTGKVLNALEHYSLAQTSAAARVKLVNLWSAMECFASSSGSGSVIGSVCGAVTPIIVWRRTSKILSYVSGVLDRLKGKNGNLGSGFPADEGGVRAERLMLALARPVNHPDIVQLLNFCGSQNFLRHRVYSLWESFSSPRRLASELDLSARRVDWHLYRIYRARNLIVHEGQEIPHVAQLLENAHYYFSVALSRILHGMQMNPRWNLADSINYWRSRKEYTLSRLFERPDDLQVIDFFPMPHPNLSKARIWPTDAATSVNPEPGAVSE